jgi:hypothetical protein
LMINEDINIVSFIRYIVFENVQMREKMVWYVESPIVLNVYCLHWFKCIMFFYLQSSIGIPTLHNWSYLVVCSFVIFLLAIMLSVLLRFTNSDYLFGFFKLYFINI